MKFRVSFSFSCCEGDRGPIAGGGRDMGDVVALLLNDCCVAGVGSVLLEELEVCWS